MLERLGFLDDALYISHASLPHQQFLPLADAPTDAPYFSMILLYKGGALWGVEKPIIVSLSKHGADLARGLGMEWHARQGSFDGTKPHAEFADTPAHLREIFAMGRPLIGICSVGILVRALSGQLAE